MMRRLDQDRPERAGTIPVAACGAAFRASPIAVLAAALLAASPVVQAANLLDAWRAAAVHDSALQAAAAAREAALEAGPQARAALLPQLGVQAAAWRERYRFDGGEPPAADPNAPQPVSERAAELSAERRAYGLTLRQPLWDLESLLRLRQARLQAAQADAEFLDARQTLMLRVAQAYFDVLAAADALTAHRAERSAYATLVEQARRRLETGLGARIGVDEAQAFHALTEQSVIDAELALHDAYRALLTLTGEAALRVAPLQERIALLPPQPAAVEDWLAAARAHNPAVRAAALRAEVAARETGALRARHAPTLALEAGSGRTELAPELGGDQRVDRVGVVLDWPLLAGGAVRSQVRAAAALARQAEAGHAGALQQAEREILAAWRGVIGGIHRIQANARAVEANRVALEASRHGMAAGARTEFDLLNAQNNYYAALRAYTESRYVYLTAALRLRAHSGQLEESDLAAIDAQLVAGRDALAAIREGDPQ